MRVFALEPEPDVLLPPPPGGAEIALFGVVHGDPNCTRSAEYILRYRPEVVVVETAINDAHGSACGNIAHRDDALRAVGGPLGTVDGRTRALAHVAARLADLPDPLSSDIWTEFSSSPWFSSEHMAYAAAFAVSARLIAGDRPKHTTYQRLLWLPDIVDLDKAFGLQSALNYHDLVSGMISPIGYGAGTETTGLVERIFILERDAVLLRSLYEASLEVGEGSGRSVVGVVGASHVIGMQHLWKDEKSWKSMADAAMLLPTTQQDEETDFDDSHERFGVRRALLEALLRLCCRTEVLADLSETLGPPVGDATESYSLTHELYGSSRMLLAVLDRDQLEEVCQGWRCDMWSVLEPLRAVRPCCGGRGYDHDLLLQLRMLNYELR